jgi:hypothetical protein
MLISTYPVVPVINAMQETFETLRIFHSRQLPVDQYGVHGFYRHDIRAVCG